MTDKLRSVERNLACAPLDIGLELAIAFAWSRWHQACQEALHENIAMGEPSEKTMTRVEALEESYNRLVEAKRAQ